MSLARTDVEQNTFAFPDTAPAYNQAAPPSNAPSNCQELGDLAGRHRVKAAAGANITKLSLCLAGKGGTEGGTEGGRKEDEGGGGREERGVGQA